MANLHRSLNAVFLFIFVFLAHLPSQSRAQTPPDPNEPSDPKEDTVYITDRQLLDFFLENYSDREIVDATYETANVLKDLKNVYEFKSPVVAVPNTRYRIKGPNPQCGGNSKPDVGQDVKEMVAALLAIASGVDAALESPGIISFIAGQIANIIIEKNKYQTEANCALVCTPLPALINQDEFKKSARLRVLYGDRSPTDMIDSAPGAVHGWARFEELQFSESSIEWPIGSNAALGSKLERNSCPIVLACTRLRNWSHNVIRYAQMIVSVDASPEMSRQCLDFTTLNTAQYGKEIRRVLDNDQYQITRRYKEAVAR